MIDEKHLSKNILLWSRWKQWQAIKLLTEKIVWNSYPFKLRTQRKNIRRRCSKAIGDEIQCGRSEREKWRPNKVLLYSTESYIQYLLITYNGKEFEKEHICILWICIYEYICIYISLNILNHFAEYLKLTQHCKSTILPFKKMKSTLQRAQRKQVLLKTHWGPWRIEKNK